MDSISAKTYCKIVTVAAAGVSVVELRDTSGSFIGSNYFQISASAAGAWYVQPSGLYAGVAINPSSTSLTSSGAGGFVVNGPTGIETVLPRRVKQLTVSNISGSAGSIIINYGVMQGNNTLKGIDGVGA
jgi:hypothetical protein